MKRTPLQRTTPLARDPQKTREWGEKKRQPLAPVSAKRVGQNVLYNRAKVEYFAQFPLCRWPGCHRKATELHHSRGRVGTLLWDKNWFRGLCFDHHRRAHDYPEEAKANEVSFTRLGMIEGEDEK